MHILRYTRSVMSILRVLHREDNSMDAELIHSRLETDGLECSVDRVSTRLDFEASLRSGKYDLVLSDFSMPGFDGLSALKMTQSFNPELPFIFLSGTIGEERAIES